MFKTLHRPPATSGRRYALYSRATSPTVTHHQFPRFVSANVVQLLEQLEIDGANYRITSRTVVNYLRLVKIERQLQNRVYGNTNLRQMRR